MKCTHLVRVEERVALPVRVDDRVEVLRNIVGVSVNTRREIRCHRHARRATHCASLYAKAEP